MNRLTTENPEIQVRFEFIRTLSQKALGIIDRGDVAMWLKDDGTHVTEIDIALNKLFIELVEQRFPKDLVWGEELQNTEKDIRLAEDRWVWSLDPIDSTRSLVESLKSEPQRFKDNVSTILASATPPGEIAPVIGVVHSPFRTQKATAYAHGGRSFYQTSSTSEPKLLQVNRVFAPRSIEQIERFESSSWRGASPDLQHFGELVPFARKINHQLFMAAVALGDVDSSTFPGPSHPHDVAPGALIVHNAGGHVRTFNNKTFREVDWREDDAINGVVATVRGELAEAIVERVNETQVNAA
jgi:fructose-1,6-bisphosphatase/inositol monophosphatase family enzyme